MGPLALFAVAAGLWAAPARAESFYENNRSYYFAMGDLRCAGGLVDVPTGAVRIKFPMLKLPCRLGPEVAWYFNSQDNTDGPLGKGTSTSLDWKTYQDANYHWYIIAPGHRRYAFDDYFYDWHTNSYYYRDTRDVTSRNFDRFFPEILAAFPA
jgi:hypothetical protein